MKASKKLYSDGIILKGHFLSEDGAMREVLRFIIKFFLIFALCYYGTKAIIGLAAPGRYYSYFVDRYLDYVSWIKSELIIGSQLLLSLFGIDTYRVDPFILRIVKGTGVTIAYDCVGYGVFSFWIAFVIASADNFKKKIGWLIGGLLLLNFINIIRISLLLVALNKKWPMPLGIDHHTWFNIISYLCIFIMMYFFSKPSAEIKHGSNPNELDQKPVQQ